MYTARGIAPGGSVLMNRCTPANVPVCSFKIEQELCQRALQAVALVEEVAGDVAEDGRARLAVGAATTVSHPSPTPPSTGLLLQAREVTETGGAERCVQHVPGSITWWATDVDDNSSLRATNRLQPLRDSPRL